MQGLMQDVPLAIPHIFERAEKYHPHKGIVTATGSGLERTTYGEWAARTRKLGGVLDDLGISADGRVATFAWNTARHLELYFAAPCTGRVLHTLNIRLFPEQLTYIVNHADDEVIFVDRSLLGLLAPLLPTFERLQHLVMMDDGKGDIPADLNGHELLDYEELLAAAEPVEFGVDDEHRAASMCYTSGTTGNPKGVVYTPPFDVPAHDGCDDRRQPRRPRERRDPARRADVPRQRLGPRSRRRRHRRRPRHARARSVRSGDRQADRRREGHRRRRRPHDLDGGAARAEGQGHLVAAQHPVRRLGRSEGVVGGLPRADRPADPPGVGDDRDQPDRCGVPSRRRPGAAARRTSRPSCAPRSAASCSVPSAASSSPAPPPGAVGRREQRRAAVSRQLDRGRLLRRPRSRESFTDDGWLKTGDVATVDERGFVRLVDRTKDLIKSGGEWISSVELENELMAHPKIAEAAVIGVAHEKWGEAPLACVVVALVRTSPRTRCSAFLEGKIAKWQMPKGVVWIDEVPKTSVGKFSKKTLRDEYADTLMDG
jgi:acyl-CoA synthetase (AMP-forming)/AMP-acid ligase II